MSDHFLTLIPVDPEFVPPRKAQKAAAALLSEAVPAADEVTSEVDEGIQFRDCGENFERVGCPRCGKGISMETWQEWMSSAFSADAGFRLGAHTMPCCGGKATLNDLTYDWAQGFSRYSLRVMNASRELPDAVLPQLEKVLGCRLRVICQAI